MAIKNRSTISDVARLASVSVATVSRYLNGTAFVNEDTAKRVDKAVRALDYHPNKMARALKMERSNMVMMVVPDIANPYYAQQYKVVQDIAEENGLTLLLYDTNGLMERELEALRIAQENRCDGLIWQTMYRSSGMDERIAALTIPCVTPYVKDQPEDHDLCIYNMTKYLISLGHKYITYVGGLPGTWINEQRRRAFVKAMDEAGLAYDDDELFEMDFTVAAGMKAGRFIASLKDRPTAVCAANDQIAVGLVLALKECGLSVPDDISVTGMDDIEIARLMSPSLTSVRNDPAPMAGYMIRSLLMRIRGEEGGLVPEPNSTGEVIERESTRRI